MSVGRICIREVDIIDESESAQVAASRMHARKTGTLVVLNRDRMPIGIVTDRDLTVRVLAEAKDPVQTTIRDVMTPCPRTVREDTPIEDALRQELATWLGAARYERVAARVGSCRAFIGACSRWIRQWWR